MAKQCVVCEITLNTGDLLDNDEVRLDEEDCDVQELLAPDEAYEWLLSNEYHGATEEHFEKKLPPEFWHDSSEPVVSES